MKRILLVSIFVGLLAGQASAAMFDLDVPTALQFTNAGIVSGAGDLLNGVLTVTQDNSIYGGAIPMSGAVGFKANIEDGPDADKFVTLQVSAGDNAGLSSTWDGIQSYVQNDNDRIWKVELFYTDSSGVDHPSGFATLANSGGSTVLSVPGSVDLGTILDIGLRIKLDNNIAGDADTFHISAVPVPGAALLGLLGMGVAGWRLRKFA